MKYKLTQDNYTHILKVAGYTMGSAVMASLVSFLGDLEVPAQYMFIVPIINIILVTGKEYLNSQR